MPTGTDFCRLWIDTYQHLITLDMEIRAHVKADKECRRLCHWTCMAPGCKNRRYEYALTEEIRKKLLESL